MIRFNAISLRSISRCIPAINWTSDKPDVCLCFNSDVSLLNGFFITRFLKLIHYKYTNKLIICTNMKQVKQN